MDKTEIVPKANLIYSVLKALDVLECLASADHPLSARDVAERCGFSRPTAYRLLTTLLTRHYVQNAQDGQYQIGTRILNLGKSLLDRLDLPEVAQAPLQELCQTVMETVHLAILDGAELLYVAKVESSQQVRMHCTIGTRNPLYSTAMGKAILAFLPEERRTALLDQISFKYRTPTTITDREQLVNHLRMVRAQGYAIDDMENEEAIRCVGAPIFDHTGDVIAALSASGPAFRLSDFRLQELSGPVMRTARIVSEKLGYVGEVSPPNSLNRLT